jgi:hypothetical protein
MTEAPERIRSHKDAADCLGDAPFLAYALVQGFKLTIALLAKRWPFLA